MIQSLAILAFILAIALVALDFFILRPGRSALAGATQMRKIDRMLYIVFVVSVVGMTLSGVASVATGHRMHGWMLILHMTLAPLYSICIAGLAVLWSNQLHSTGRVFASERTAFWIVVAASFVVILSAMFGMMTWFGSAYQETWLNTHRIAAFALVVAAAFQAARLLPRQKSA